MALRDNMMGGLAANELIFGGSPAGDRPAAKGPRHPLPLAG